jgi:hypothetical protein
MMAIDIALIALIAVSLVVYIGEPLVRRVPSTPYGRAEEDETERLVLRKEMLYVAIRDLDFDFQTGKVDQQDYTELRQQLETDAVHILRQLDTVDPLLAFDNAVEHQVLALRRHRLSTADGSRPETCSRCRTVLENDENFCPCCGQALRLA